MSVVNRAEQWQKVESVFAGRDTALSVALSTTIAPSLSTAASCAAQCQLIDNTSRPWYHAATAFFASMFSGQSEFLFVSYDPTDPARPPREVTDWALPDHGALHGVLICSRSTQSTRKGVTSDCTRNEASAHTHESSR